MTIVEQEFEKALTRVSDLELALANMLRWFKSYPELVPSAEVTDRVRKAIEDAKEVLKGDI